MLSLVKLHMEKKYSYPFSISFPYPENVFTLTRFQCLLLDSYLILPLHFSLDTNSACENADHWQWGTVFYIHFKVGFKYSNGNLTWGQNINRIIRLTILQKKALRSMNFKPRNFHISPLFWRLSILKLPEKINLEIRLLISKATNNSLPSLFNNWFTFSSEIIRDIDRPQLKVYWKSPQSLLQVMAYIQ